VGFKRFHLVNWCEKLPQDVYAVSLVAIVNLPYENHQRFPSRLSAVVTADLTLALGVLEQQIQVRDIRSYSNGASCEVKFSVYGGGEFDYKANVVEIERAFKRLLDDKDSQLSRSLYSYETFEASSAFLSAAKTLVSVMAPLSLVLFLMMF